MGWAKITTMQGSWRGTRSLRNVNLQPFCNADGHTAWSEAKRCAVLGPNQSQYCSQNKHLRAWRTCENKAHPLLTAAIWSASTLKISGLGAKPPRRNLDSRVFFCLLLGHAHLFTHLTARNIDFSKTKIWAIMAHGWTTSWCHEIGHVTKKIPPKFFASSIFMPNLRHK